MIKFQFILLLVVFQSLLLMEMGLSLPMEKEKQFTPVDVCPKYSNFYGYQLSHQGCCLDELNCPVQLLAQNAMVKSKLQAISKERRRDEIKRRRKRSLIHHPPSTAVNPYVQKSAAHLLTLCRNNVSIINPVYATSATTHGHVQLVQLPPLLTQSIAVHTCEERETPIVRGSCIQHYKWESVYVVTPRKYEIVDSMSEYVDSDEVTFKREWILVGAGCELRLYTDSGDFDSSYFHYPEYDKLPKPKINGLNYVHLKEDQKYEGTNHGAKQTSQQKQNGQYASASSQVIPVAPPHAEKTNTVHGQQGSKASYSPPKPPTAYSSSKPPATDSTPPTPAEYSPSVAPPTHSSPQPPAAYSSPEPTAAYSPPESPAAYPSPAPPAAYSPPELPAAYSPPESLESSPPPEVAVPYSGPKPLEAYFPYELSQPTSPPKPPAAYSPPKTPVTTDINSETYSPLSPYKVPKINTSGYNATLYALNLTKESTAYPPPPEPTQINPPTDNKVAYPPSEMSSSLPPPETQIYPEPETPMYPPPETQIYPETETQIYTPPDTQSQTYPEPETQIYPEPETQIYTQPEIQSQIKPQPEIQSQTYPQPETQTYPQPETQTYPQPETQTYPQPETQTYPQPETLTNPQPETQTYPLPETPTDTPPQPSPEYPSIQRETNGNGTAYDIQNSNYTIVYVNGEGQPIGYGESSQIPPSPTTETTSPEPSPAYPTISNYTTTNETSYTMETSNYTVVYVNESGNPIAYAQVAPGQYSNTSYPPGDSEGYNATSDTAPLPQIYGRGKSDGEGSSQGSQIHGYRVPQGGAAPGQGQAPPAPGQGQAPPAPGQGQAPLALGQEQAPPPPSVAYHASPTTTEYINSGAVNSQEPGQYDGGRLIQNPGGVPPGGYAYAPWTNGQYPRLEYGDEEYPYISYPRDARNSGYSSLPAGGDVPRNPYAKPYRGVYTPPNKIGVPIYSMKDNPDRIHELMSSNGHP